VGNSKWDHYAVRAILTHPKYAGCAVFGRTASKLYTPIVKLPKSEWIVRPGAFESIIDAATFAEAQRAYEGRNLKKTNQELLDSLRALLASEGKLTLDVIQSSDEVPSASTYRSRFGNLRNLYKLIGYDRSGQFDRIDMRNRIGALREELAAQIVAMFPNDVSIVRRGGHRRYQLRISNGLIVSVLVARSTLVWKETRRWLIEPVRNECKLITLLARLDATNRSFLDVHVFPSMDRPNRFQISMSDAWLDRGRRLGELSQLLELVAWARAIRRSKPRK